MANVVYYSKTALTGGAATALDYIDGDLLVDGDIAHVSVSGILYTYKLNATSGEAEASPNVIAPDTNAGNKRWILQQSIPFSTAGAWNLKPTVNAAVNKLDVFTKSGGAAPTASNVIAVSIPDGNGHTLRTRGAAYLSGTSQIVLANATNYWSKGILASEIKTAWLYAIWDGTGIVWALAGYSGFNRVPTTTTETDDDFFLLEVSSTYTRSNDHYCIAVAKIRYEYDTSDDPDHTIQATVEDAPRVVWNPKSDYGKTVSLATTTTSGADIADGSVASAVVKQSGIYSIHGNLTAFANVGALSNIAIKIKTGSATYGSATEKAASLVQTTTATGAIPLNVKVALNSGDTIHLGGSVGVTGAGNRYIYGDDTYLRGTSFTFNRVD